METDDIDLHGEKMVKKLKTVEKESSFIQVIKRIISGVESQLSTHADKLTCLPGCIWKIKGMCKVMIK